MTDLRALAAALATGNVIRIHDVLFPPAPPAPVDPPLPPQKLRMVKASLHIDDPAYSPKSMAVHFLRRFAEAIEHGWRIEPAEVDIALEFMYASQPDLRPSVCLVTASDYAEHFVEPVRCVWCGRDEVDPQYAPMCSQACVVAAEVD